MTLDDFTKKIADLFFDTDASEITPKTVFKNLSEWSSLVALSVMAMIEDEYGIRIKGEDIRNSETVEDLYTSLSNYSK